MELFKEYFEHGDTQEVVDSLEELSIKNFKHEVWLLYGELLVVIHHSLSNFLPPFLDYSCSSDSGP